MCHSVPLYPHSFKKKKTMAAIDKEDDGAGGVSAVKIMVTPGKSLQKEETKACGAGGGRAERSIAFVRCNGAICQKAAVFCT